MYRNTVHHHGPVVLIGVLLLAACNPLVNVAGTPTVTLSKTVTLATVGSSGSTTLITSEPTGIGYSKVTIDLGSNFLAANICSSATIFGIMGTATCAVPGTSTVVPINSYLYSTANRTVGTTPINVLDETSTYRGVALPTTGGYTYREVPDLFKDDDGYSSADAACVLCTPNLPITSAQHAALSVCGTTKTTVADRIAHCDSLNNPVSTWIGATQAGGGQSTWKLVTKSSLGKEVWQDQRTGLLWSSLTAVGINWCQAGGNNDSTDVTCTGNTVSTCAESLYPISGTPTSYYPGDNYSTGVYDDAKGGMGLASQPSIHWRLPNLRDFDQAIVDGIAFIMPDSGALSTGTRRNWAATVASNNRVNAWWADSSNFTTNATARSSVGNYYARCVGR
jgi:hypothetical protein